MKVQWRVVGWVLVGWLVATTAVFAALSLGVPDLLLRIYAGIGFLLVIWLGSLYARTKRGVPFWPTYATDKRPRPMIAMLLTMSGIAVWGVAVLTLVYFGLLTLGVLTASFLVVGLGDLMAYSALVRHLRIRRTET